MLRSRVFLGLILVAALSLVVPSLTAAPRPRPQSCQVDYCPSAGLYFICCPWMPDCQCQTCPDYC